MAKEKNTDKKKLYGVTYGDVRLRDKMLDIQFNLWQETKVKHTMEKVLSVLIDHYNTTK